MIDDKKWTPETLVKKLKERVIGQDSYLKDLCTAVWLHILRKQVFETTGCSLPGPKLNQLVIGNPGTGKTEAIRSLAKILDLNLVIEDASLFTGAGWKGREVSSIIKDVMLLAGNDNLKAKYSIVVLDEIDKVCMEPINTAPTFPAINNFLKLMEGANIEHEGENTIYRMDTTDILFICLGAFDGLDKIISSRIRNGNEIGFCAERSIEPINNIFQYVQKKDLIRYGMNPQFLGRITMITTTNELTEDDLYNILKESQISPANQLSVLLRAGLGVHIIITKAAARYIAARAIKEGTGARALFSEITEVLKDGLYQIAERDDIWELQLDYTSQNEITLRYITGKREELPVYSSDFSKSRLNSEEWTNIPLDLIKYGSTQEGVYQFVEEMVDDVELKGCHALSDRYTHRQIRAAVYLITSVVLNIIIKDVTQNMYEIRQKLQIIATDLPDIPDVDVEDSYVSYYRKSIDYNSDIRNTVAVALYVLEEYCLRRLEECGKDKELK